MKGGISYAKYTFHYNQSNFFFISIEYLAAIIAQYYSHCIVLFAGNVKSFLSSKLFKAFNYYPNCNGDPMD